MIVCVLLTQYVEWLLYLESGVETIVCVINTFCWVVPVPVEWSRNDSLCILFSHLWREIFIPIYLIVVMKNHNVTFTIATSSTNHLKMSRFVNKKLIFKDRNDPTYCDTMAMGGTNHLKISRFVNKKLILEDRNDLTYCDTMAMSWKNHLKMSRFVNTTYFWRS